MHIGLRSEQFVHSANYNTTHEDDEDDDESELGDDCTSSIDWDQVSQLRVRPHK